MQTRRIPITSLPKIGTYAKSVIEDGHLPGVLSGGALRGKAKLYGGWYSRQRAAVTDALAQLGIESELVLSEGPRPRWTRVWTYDGRPVKVILEGPHTFGPYQHAEPDPRWILATKDN